MLHKTVKNLKYYIFDLVWNDLKLCKKYIFRSLNTFLDSEYSL